MRICVVGAGVIGSIYGQLFAESGNQVRHLVHPGRGLGLREGLQVHLLDSRSGVPETRQSTYHPTIIETLDPNFPFDLIVASVRHYQLPVLLPILAAGAGTAEILFFGNLWSSLDPIDAHLKGRYSLGFPIAGGGFEDGRLEAAMSDEVLLGDPGGFEVRRFQLLKNLFESCGLCVTAQPSILDWLWVHFAVEAGIVGTAMKYGVEDFLGSVDYITEAVVAVRDALDVTTARGVNTWLRSEARMYYSSKHAVAHSLFDLYQEDEVARTIITRHLSAELQRIYHDVVATGRELDVPTPWLTSLAPYVYSRRLVSA